MVRAAASPATPLTTLDTLDRILERYSSALGDDFETYRNHAYRVANLCAAALGGSPRQLEQIAIASAFHDLGIWTERTFDYLEPSAALAREYLLQEDRESWIPEITAAILQHHKVSRYRGGEGPLVDVFRRADWGDVSLGLIGHRISRDQAAAVVERWPRLGFHRMLLRLTWRRFLTHPWSPLPMLKL
jgi:hypothetical protein